MSTQTAVAIKEPPSVIQDMANRYGMDKKAFEATIRATAMPSNVQVSPEQFCAFLLVAKQYNLNPVTKEIYAFPSKGGIQPIVGIDGWCNIINSNPMLDGIEFVDHLAEGKLTAITCRIHRKDREHPTECVEYMDECKKGTEPWQKWPARMLRHKALIQCARYAFSLSGIVDQDEAERMEMVDVTPPPDIKPYDVDKSKPASPFKKAGLRKDFMQAVDKEYGEAQTIEELESMKETRKPILDAMQESGDERDTMVLDTLNNKYEMMHGRLSAPSDEAEENIPFIRKQMEEERERLASMGRE
jgi:phage recombination protein Bet